MPKSLFVGLLLVATTPFVSCKGPGRCKGAGGDTHNVVGGSVSWCDWEILDRSGREPNWKKSVDAANLEFCGEGVGQTEAEARERAEDDMRIQAARYLKTDVTSIMVLRESNSDEAYDAQHQTSTDVSVKQMAVSDFYWEKRRRIGHQFGLEIQDKDYRVLVIGRLSR